MFYLGISHCLHVVSAPFAEFPELPTCVYLQEQPAAVSIAASLMWWPGVPTYDIIFPRWAVSPHSTQNQPRRSLHWGSGQQRMKPTCCRRSPLVEKNFRFLDRCFEIRAIFQRRPDDPTIIIIITQPHICLPCTACQCVAVLPPAAPRYLDTSVLDLERTLSRRPERISSARKNGYPHQSAPHSKAWLSR